MIKSYLKTAVRALTRNKAFSLINILGLVIGISFSCMLYVYVSNELSYDTFHSKSDRIVRVLTVDRRDPQNVRRYGVTVPAMGPELISHYPEAEEMVRLHRFVGQVVFDVGGQHFQERNWYTTDANFFDVFDFEFISGDKATALKEPHSLVLTESMAKKYFGQDSPLGEMIEKTSFGPVRVTGVVKDPPGNSHLKFDMLFSQVVPDDSWTKYLNSWEDFDAYTYVVLQNGHSIGSLRSKMPGLRDKKLSKFSGGIDIDFQPMEDIYLRSADIEGGAESGRGQMSYIYIFSSMGVFLLLIACINYINLATANAMVRSREVGVRKVAGAKRGQLVLQFLMESFVITIISAGVSVLVMKLVFPYFNQITGKQFEITRATLMTYIPPLTGIACIIGVISGSYPAFYLAKLKPVSSLRGATTAKGTAGLRKMLVVFQFVITIVMIVSTLVIGRQMNFIQEKDMGFDKSRLMVIDINSGEVRRQFRTIKDEFSKIPGIQHVAASSRVPGEWKDIAELYFSSPASPYGTPDSMKTYFMGFDEDMLATYQFKLKSGRYFSLETDGDSTHILLNEAAVRALGITDPLGAIVSLRTGKGELNTTVIGVISDFNFQSLHQKVEPIVIGAWNNSVQPIDYFTLKISGDAKQAIPAVTRVHEKFDQRTPIEYHFLDAQLENFYQAENRAAMIFRMGGVLSISVACLGLFGLATYNIRRRIKELGIRKVLGANGWDLFFLLSSSFLKQVGVAFLIATPLAWYMMKEWLKVFEYRISLDAGIFILAGIIAASIALATVSYRTLKAVQGNPVDSLRQE